MKNFLLVVFAVVLGLFSCEDDKPDDLGFPPLDGENVDYSKMFTKEKLGDVSAYIPLMDTKIGQVADMNGNLFSQWKTVPDLLGTQQIGVQWGSPGQPHGDFAEQMGTEVWQVKYDCQSGHNYVWLNGYGDDDGNVLWPVNLTKALFINENTKDTFNITYGGTCASGGGHPYMLFDLYDEPYTIKIWHDIKDPMTGIVLKRVYWQQTVTPFIEIVNPIWEDEGSDTRMTIHQAEAWWDSDGGWAGNASGDMEDLSSPISSISSQGYQEPTGGNVVYAHDQWWAKGADGDPSGWYAWKLYDRSNKHTGYLKYGWKY